MFHIEWSEHPSYSQPPHLSLTALWMFTRLSKAGILKYIQWSTTWLNKNTSNATIQPADVRPKGVII